MKHMRIFVITDLYDEGLSRIDIWLGNLSVTFYRRGSLEVLGRIEGAFY